VPVIQFREILESYFERNEGTTTLAKKYGINPTTIQKWLSGENRSEEVKALMKLKNWNLSETRTTIQRKAAKLRGLNSEKKRNCDLAKPSPMCLEFYVEMDTWASDKLR